MAGMTLTVLPECGIMRNVFILMHCGDLKEYLKGSRALCLRRHRERCVCVCVCVCGRRGGLSVTEDLTSMSSLSSYGERKEERKSGGVWRGVGGGRGLERNGRINAGEEMNAREKSGGAIVSSHEGYESSSAYWL